MLSERRTISWVTVFAAAFALVEGAVVVYLRGLYYPDGFSLPLRVIGESHLIVELAREGATIVMLAAVGAVAGNSRWRKVSYFMIAFGVWDIFYYVWLKVFLNWPASFFDCDILFLIPIPWLGPVIAPVLISVLMIATGILIVQIEKKRPFRPALRVILLSTLGVGVILFTFMSDLDASLRSAMPGPYSYGLFFGGFALLVLAFVAMVRDAGVR